MTGAAKDGAALKQNGIQKRKGRRTVFVLRSFYQP
jgi:hypothetical protein